MCYLSWNILMAVDRTFVPFFGTSLLGLETGCLFADISVRNGGTCGSGEGTRCITSEERKNTVLVHNNQKRLVRM